jgi:hypothetical protein
MAYVFVVAGSVLLWPPAGAFTMYCTVAERNDGSAHLPYATACTPGGRWA